MIANQVEFAWQVFDNAVGYSETVIPAAPILFFGNLSAYQNSHFRVVTVGLNPSLHEFPADSPFYRFPAIADQTNRNLSDYLEALSRYFFHHPYSSWFNSFEPLLNGMGASYYQGHKSTVLHTDICSPVATNPTWSRLDENRRRLLVVNGSRLWHMLMNDLRPQIIIFSIARVHLERIKFVPQTNWNVIFRIAKTSSGKSRSKPYDISTRWYYVEGESNVYLWKSSAIAFWPNIG
ncbi:MAG: hypothetical protein OXE41_10225 [Gammaproteobacteria bacterium]|nr:hypothetical protein [Gammaproteobacteria bacterium]